MRKLFVVLGGAAIIAYAILGALLMTRWEPVAGSGVPLKETIAAMEAADQPYSIVPGILFATAGIFLALVWALTVKVTNKGITAWFYFAWWGSILALGAPAYFFASFGNMNSVGDTFYDWDLDAAFALVSPLYIASGIAALLAIMALVVALVQQRKKQARI